MPEETPLQSSFLDHTLKIYDKVKYMRNKFGYFTLCTLACE